MQGTRAGSGPSELRDDSSYRDPLARGAHDVLRARCGSLREYMGHLLYKWLNYYVCMSKTSPCTPMSVFYAVFFANRTQWMVLSAISEKRGPGGTSAA